METSNRAFDLATKAVDSIQDNSDVAVPETILAGLNLLVEDVEAARSAISDSFRGKNAEDVDPFKSGFLATFLLLQRRTATEIALASGEYERVCSLTDATCTAMLRLKRTGSPRPRAD